MKSDLIVMIMLGLLAVYILYVTFIESWTTTNDILIIKVLTAGLIWPPMLERIWKRSHGRVPHPNIERPTLDKRSCLKPG